MSLKSATNFTGGISRADLASQIIAESSLVAWFSSRAADAELTGGLVDVLNDRKGGSLELRGSGTTRPSIVANQFGTVSGIVFDGTDDVLGLFGTFDRTIDFTVVLVLKATDGVAFSSFTDVTHQTTVLVQAGQINFNDGNGFIAAPYTNGDQVLVIASASTSRLSLRVGAQQTVFSASDSMGGAATFCVGALNGSGSLSMDGSIADALLFNAELLNDDAFETLDKVRAYVRAIYPTVAL